MRYDFRALDNGEIREFVMPMKDAPGIGKTITHDGRVWEQLAHTAAVQVGFKEFTSMQIADGDPDVPHWDPKTGDAGFKTQKEVDEYVDKRNARGEPIVWNR